MLGYLLKTLAIGFLIGGVVAIAFAGQAVLVARSIESVAQSGLEAIGRLERGQRTAWKGVAGYTVDLAWTDRAGKRRTARQVPLSAATAREIIRGGQLVVLAAPIKYADAGSENAAVLANDAAPLLRELWARATRYALLAGAFVLVFLGTLIGLRRMKASRG